MTDEQEHRKTVAYVVHRHDGRSAQPFYCVERCASIAITQDCEPFTQIELDDLAHYRQAPIHCAHCRVKLAEVN